jgi:hypothetical protein
LVIQLLLALTFVLLGIIGWWLSSRLTRASVAALAHSRSRSLFSRVASWSAPLFLFAQYWALTGTFPIFIVVFYYGLFAVARVFSYLITTITGHNQPEVRNKVSTLATIGGMRFPLIGCASGVALAIVIVTSWITSLWIFFSFDGSPLVAQLYIAMSHFTVPSVLYAFVLCIVSLPIVTSAYVDDDIRTSHLLTVFTATIFLTGWLMLPIYLMHQPEVALQPALSKGWFSLQKSWVILPIPLFVFLVGGVLPFFIGMYRYRAQVNAILEWRRTWLTRMNEIFALPLGPNRTAEIDSLLAEIHHAIKARFEENDLFQHFFTRLSNRLDAYYSSTESAQSETSLKPSQIPQTELSDDTGKSLALPGSSVLDGIERAKLALQRPFRDGTAVASEPPSSLIEEVQHLVWKNQDKLIEWDLRFSDLWELLNLYRHTYESANKELGNFLKFKLEQTEKDVSRLSKKNNLLGGAIVAVGSALLTWLLPIFEPKIVAIANNAFAWID